MKTFSFQPKLLEKYFVSSFLSLVYLAYIQEAEPVPAPVDLRELAKEKLQISYLIENVFLITVDSGKYSEGIGGGEATDQLLH